MISNGKTNNKRQILLIDGNIDIIDVLDDHGLNARVYWIKRKDWLNEEQNNNNNKYIWDPSESFVSCRWSEDNYFAMVTPKAPIPCKIL